MNKSPYAEKNSRFFYTVVAISVLSILAAAVGIFYTAKRIRSAGKEPTNTSVDWDNHSGTVSENKANKDETGVKDDRTTKADESETTENTTEKQSESTTAAAATEKAIECSLPLGTNILKDYSNGTMVKSKTMNDWRTHNGVDFTGEQGDEVHAVCGGNVKEIKRDASWGNVIVIEHENGLTGRYCGFDSVSVKEGEKVAKDDVLGTLGVIPIESADVTHLHFEMIKNGEYVDPIEALSMHREED